MPSASSAAAREQNRSNQRAASPPLRDLPPPSLPGRPRVVIRLPAIALEAASLPAEPTSVLPAPPLPAIADPIPSQPFGGAVLDDPVPVAPNAAEEMTTFAIPSSHSETATPTKNVSPDSGPATPEGAASIDAPEEPAGPLRHGVATAWRLVRQGHAFVMQPKVWLACVVCCFAVLLTVFVLLPPAEPVAPPKPAAKTPPAKPKVEPPAEVAARIVAPPADLAPSADARHFEAQSSAGFAGPLDSPPAGQSRANGESSAPGEELRIAAEAKLGPGGSRYDGQATTSPRGGAAIYDVAPLDHSDESTPEGGSLR